MPTVTMIAVTGGPCGGKSTFLAKAFQWLGEHNIYAIVLSETATELISAGLSPKVMGLERFQEAIISYSIKREESYLAISSHMDGRNDVVILCDRGVLDCIAYVGEESFSQIISRLGLKHHELRNRYKLVVHMVTAAHGAREHYTLANNQARSETPEEAIALDLRTQEAWLGHPHHVIIDNSTDFDGKIRRTLRAFARVLNMPEPLEIERKFKVENFSTEMIPGEAVAIEIEQDYLISKDLPSPERRVRKMVHGGEASYFYTEKTPTEKKEARVERERRINESEYLALLRERETFLHTIKKTRYCFLYEGKRFELDVYHSGALKKMGLVILEVELTSIDEEVRFPVGWEIVEVTDNPKYKNRALAVP